MKVEIAYGMLCSISQQTLSFVKADSWFITSLIFAAQYFCKDDKKSPSMYIPAFSSWKIETQQ